MREKLGRVIIQTYQKMQNIRFSPPRLFLTVILLELLFLLSLLQNTDKSYNNHFQRQHVYSGSNRWSLIEQ